MTIVLTGFMGAGKTTVGEALARALGLRLVDLDREIEEESGLSVREIFERSGEPEFRRLEKTRLEAALRSDGCVIATGGGTLVDSDNLEMARSRAVVVWLNPTFATLMARIGPAGKLDRPLFRNETAAFELYRSRLDAYRQADLRIDVDSREEPDEVAARVALRLAERTCST